MLQWLIKDKCRLITILVMGGVGKTALAVKLAQEVSGEFDYIIWRSLRLIIFEPKQEVILQWISA